MSWASKFFLLTIFTRKLTPNQCIPKNPTSEVGLVEQTQGLNLGHNKLLYNIHMNIAKVDEIRQIIKNNPHIIWYVKDLFSISVESMVEHILNYGTWEDFKNLVNILGLKDTAQIFYKTTSLPRSNYRENYKYYFDAYFKAHAQ